MAVEFFNSISNPRYHLIEPSIPAAVFHGQTAKILGIAGQEVTEQAHLRLLEGLSPHTGDRLPGMRNAPKRQPGWDITFNQHKALSVLEHVAGDARIGEVRRRAIHTSMGAFERKVRVAVRKQSQMDGPKVKGWKYPERIAANVVYSLFDHPASREGDPHGHGHVVIYNLSHDRVEGQFKAAVTRFIGKREMAEISGIYHKELAKGVRKLGYDARWDGKEFTMGGVPEMVVSEFSRRRNAIDRKAKEYDQRALEAGNRPMGSRSRQKLGLHDRPEKEWLPYDERRRGWLARLTDAQRSGLAGMVSRAKSAVRSAAYRVGLKNYADRLRSYAMVREADAHVQDRSRRHGSGRGR